jgi:DNA-binding SARP family transcriptional activator
MEVRLLGPVEVHADGDQLPVRGPIQRALVARLALHANRVVASQELLRSVWGPARCWRTASTPAATPSWSPS